MPGTGHQGFPVQDGNGNLIGVVTRRDIFDTEEPENSQLRQIIKRPLAIVFEDNSLREAARPHGAGTYWAAAGGHSRTSAEGNRVAHS